MSGDDDDCAANRIKHSDGTKVAGPVVAPVSVWNQMLALLPGTISNQPVANLVAGLTALNS